MRNRFASLSDECATPDVLSDSSNEETVKKRSRGRSDHSSDDLEISADLMMRLSSSQEFQPATLGSISLKSSERKLMEENRLAVKLTLFLSRVTLPIVYKVKPPIKRLPNSFQYNHSSHLRRSHNMLMPLLLLYIHGPAHYHEQSKATVDFTFSASAQRVAWRKQRPARNFILLIMITTHKHLHHSIRLLGRRTLLPGTTERQDSSMPQVITISNNFH